MQEAPQNVLFDLSFRGIKLLDPKEDNQQN
jgi:hypothetical protein